MAGDLIDEGSIAEGEEEYAGYTRRFHNIFNPQLTKACDQFSVLLIKTEVEFNSILDYWIPLSSMCLMGKSTRQKFREGGGFGWRQDGQTQNGCLI